ncbi:MAG: glucosamine-6-phosphate deaminase [Ruminococcaceae bacterium]|nr:glucosamine-6-phosphate deaminase [Oscillospiraceae bacterium]
MKIIVDTPEKLAQLAAQRYVELLKNKPNAVLGYATGSTPLGLYGELARLNAAGEVSFAEATTFNLDEYVGLEGTHDQSYRYFMNKNLFDKIDIKKENTNVPCGIDMTNEKAAQYDKAIEAAGGIDLQLLGIGHNGHIGFNEPGTPFGSVTHVVDLTESTINANARFFESINDVPTQAVSMGIKTVMNARSIIFIALGADKAEIVKKMICGEVTPEVPASVLQLHPDVEVYIDHAAASLL